MNLWTQKLPVLLAAAILFSHTPDALAQEGQSREERIREHQERIKKILEESNRRREEQEQKQQEQAAPPAAPGQPATATPTAAPGTYGEGMQQPGDDKPPTAARPGQALPTGPVQNARMTPQVTKGSPTPAAQAPQSARSESRTIMLFHPMDSIVAVGSRFKTDVMAETKEGEIDEISFLIKYPRHVLNPLALDHSALDPYVKNKIEYEFNPDDGTIYLHAKLEKPHRFSQKGLVSIIWEALEPSDGAVISYEFGKDKTTGLYLKGSNLLGTMPGSDDGVIRATVQVKGPRTKPTIRRMEDNGLLIGARQQTDTDDRPAEEIQLELRPSDQVVRAGETFDVDVILRNPGEERIDTLRLYLQFNPDELRVVDRDSGNVVTRGINIHDAASRENFPFDYYRYNYADNTKGIIVYEVSASNSQVRGTGKVATIRMEALQEAPRAELVLVKNAARLSPTTDVSFLGDSKLETEATAMAQPLEGVAIRVSGQAVAGSGSDASDDVYNPFVSNLARRMRNKSN